MPTPFEILSEFKRTDVTAALGSASLEKLSASAAALCHPFALGAFGERQFTQICETVRIHLLSAQIGKLQTHVVERHDHITSLNTENGRAQRRVFWLTVAALMAGTAQTIAAILPYAGIVPTPHTASTLQTLAPKLSNPIPAIPPRARSAHKEITLNMVAARSSNSALDPDGFAAVQLGR